MLELRPTCGNRNRPLPSVPTETRIFSGECTFCADCAERVRFNVCPNCGGGFTPRPIRSARTGREDNYLGADPASTTMKHRRVDAVAQAQFSLEVRVIPPD